MNYPQFIFVTEPMEEGRLEQKIEFMKAFGLKESEITLFGIKARKLSGTIPFKMSAGKTVTEPVQETNILLAKGHFLYHFKYSYEGDRINPDLKDYFEGFTTSFSPQ